MTDENDRNQELEGLLDGVEGQLDQGDLHSALKMAKKAVRQYPDHPDAWSVLGEVLESGGDLPGAVVALQKAADLDPGWAAVRSHLAYLELETGALARASRLIEDAFEIDDGDPEACYTFAVLCELESDAERADRFYEVAAQVDPDRFHAPVRVSQARFEQMARMAMEVLPEKVRSFLGDVPVVIQDLPGRDQRGMFANNAPLLLGECIGTHMEQRGALDLADLTPARIMLYKRNLERACRDEEDLEEQVTITVLHEVLHFLGLDEDEVGARGLG